MISVTRVLSFCLLMAGMACVFGAEEAERELTSVEFISVVRNPPGRECWAKMDGKATHKRDGSKTVSAPVHLGILFTPKRTVAQVKFKNEIYNIGQSYGNPPTSTTESILEDDKPQIGVFGIRPEDLTMGFIYWPVKVENEKESALGQSCRVFTMVSPAKDETAKVYISEEYFFPLKVEWSKLSEDGKSAEAPFRTLEITSFKKEKDFWLVNSLGIFGPGWRTKIEFESRSAGFSKDGVPDDVFSVPAK